MNRKDEPPAEEQMEPVADDADASETTAEVAANLVDRILTESTGLDPAAEESASEPSPLEAPPESAVHVGPEVSAEAPPEAESERPAKTSSRIPGAARLKKRKKEPAVEPPAADTPADEAPAEPVPAVEEPEPVGEAVAAAVPGEETPPVEGAPPAAAPPAAAVPPTYHWPDASPRAGRSRLRSVVRYAVMVVFLAGLAAVALVVFKSGVMGSKGASPSPTVTASASVSPAFVWYKVKKGDTMGAILLKQHVADIDQVLQLNPGLQLNSLRVGQRIKLPPPTL